MSSCGSQTGVIQFECYTTYTDGREDFVGTFNISREICDAAIHSLGAEYKGYIQVDQIEGLYGYGVVIAMFNQLYGFTTPSGFQCRWNNRYIDGVICWHNIRWNIRRVV